MGTTNFDDLSVDSVTTSTMTTSAITTKSTTATNTATQATWAYDASNKVTMTVASGGAYTITSTDGSNSLCQTITLADDAQITFPANKSGIAKAFTEGGDDFLMAHVQDAGTVTEFGTGLGSTAVTDSDGSLCIFASAALSAAVLKNRLGASATITYKFDYK